MARTGNGKKTGGHRPASGGGARTSPASRAVAPSGARQANELEAFFSQASLEEQALALQELEKLAAGGLSGTSNKASSSTAENATSTGVGSKVILTKGPRAKAAAAPPPPGVLTGPNSLQLPSSFAPENRAAPVSEAGSAKSSQHSQRALSDVSSAGAKSIIIEQADEYPTLTKKQENERWWKHKQFAKEGAWVWDNGQEKWRWKLHRAVLGDGNNSSGGSSRASSNQSSPFKMPVAKKATMKSNKLVIDEGDEEEVDEAPEEKHLSGGKTGGTTSGKGNRSRGNTWGEMQRVIEEDDDEDEDADEEEDDDADDDEEEEEEEDDDDEEAENEDVYESLFKKYGKAESDDDGEDDDDEEEEQDGDEEEDDDDEDESSEEVSGSQEDDETGKSIFAPSSKNAGIFAGAAGKPNGGSIFDRKNDFGGGLFGKKDATPTAGVGSGKSVSIFGPGSGSPGGGRGLFDTPLSPIGNTSSSANKKEGSLFSTGGATATIGSGKTVSIFGNCTTADGAGAPSGSVVDGKSSLFADAFADTVTPTNTSTSRSLFNFEAAPRKASASSKSSGDAAGPGPGRARLLDEDDESDEKSSLHAALSRDAKGSPGAGRGDSRGGKKSSGAERGKKGLAEKAKLASKLKQTNRATTEQPASASSSKDRVKKAASSSAPPPEPPASNRSSQIFGSDAGGSGSCTSGGSSSYAGFDLNQVASPSPPRKGSGTSLFSAYTDKTTTSEKSSVPGSGSSTSAAPAGPPCLVGGVSLTGGAASAASTSTAPHATPTTFLAFGGAIPNVTKSVFGDRPMFGDERITQVKIDSPVVMDAQFGGRDSESTFSIEELLRTERVHSGTILGRNDKEGAAADGALVTEKQYDECRKQMRLALLALIPEEACERSGSADISAAVGPAAGNNAKTATSSRLKSSARPALSTPTYFESTRSASSKIAQQRVAGFLAKNFAGAGTSASSSSSATGSHYIPKWIPFLACFLSEKDFLQIANQIRISLLPGYFDGLPMSSSSRTAAGQPREVEHDRHLIETADAALLWRILHQKFVLNGETDVHTAAELSRLFYGATAAAAVSPGRGSEDAADTSSPASSTVVAGLTLSWSSKIFSDLGVGFVPLQRMEDFLRLFLLDGVSFLFSFAVSYIGELFERGLLLKDDAEHHRGTSSGSNLQLLKNEDSKNCRRAAIGVAASSTEDVWDVLLSSADSGFRFDADRFCERHWSKNLRLMREQELERLKALLVETTSKGGGSTSSDEDSDEFNFTPSEPESTT